MRLIKEVKRFELSDGLKKGDIIELENVLSCDKQVVKIIGFSSDSVKIIKLSNGETKTYTYAELDKYEARKMKLVYDDESGILSQAAQVETKKEPTKEQCEKATEAYRSNIESALRELLGKNINVVRM